MLSFVTSSTTISTAFCASNPEAGGFFLSLGNWKGADPSAFEISLKLTV